VPASKASRLVILAIDQGTTGTTCLVVDDELRPCWRGYRELPQHFPRPGWVEHDPEEIWASVVGAAEAAVRAAGVRAADLRAIGITNQRETTLLWERATGRPVDRAIVWQDRRTAPRCRELPADLIRTRTGLVPDPYFSATKLEWLLARTEARPSELAFGTVDSWLIWKLTGGLVHATDLTNASRTMLLDLASLAWDDELLELFGVDRALLPRLARSCEVVGEGTLLGATLPIAGIAGDQQAALFGHGCHGRGEAKATYGTGSFVLAHVGAAHEPAPPGLLETAAASGGYALEGAILSSGAAIQWLRDGLGLLNDPAESEALAQQVESTGGVYFVPALTGLGSPHWNAGARGLVTGITRGTTAAHLVRAALEGIAFQVADVLDALPGDVGVLRADGGGSSNGFLMQLQADLLGCPVEVAAERETTALGAAALAGLAVGTWPDTEAIRARIRRGAIYEPSDDRAHVAERRAEWQLAVRRALLT
jgi:glycerol kinase